MGYLKADPYPEHFIYIPLICEWFVTRITRNIVTASFVREAGVPLVIVKGVWSVNGDVKQRFAYPQMLAEHQRRR
jgi:hypothetical protein